MDGKRELNWALQVSTLISLSPFLSARARVQSRLLLSQFPVTKVLTIFALSHLIKSMNHGGGRANFFNSEIQSRDTEQASEHSR